MLRYNILFTLVLTTALFVQAQVEIKGTVTDANTGQALMGVTVLVEGTYTGTITETDGQFSLNISPDSAVLVFSYVGYTTNKVKIGKRKVINVALVSEEYLDGAVVIGYGKQSKAKLTSAVSTIDPKTLKKMPVPNVSNALEGMASGLFVRQGSGEPGFSGSSFEIRNFGNALVIVDGSPGNMDDLDPNEIESISILKDAAAAAVYGVQGGNGVVLITTRKGKIGKPELNYSNQFTNTAFTQYPDFLNSIQYATVLNEGLANDGQTPFYSEQQMEAFRSGSDPINYPNVDWKESMFKKWGFQQRHNLNLSGGSEKIKYFASAGFLNQGSNYTQDVLSYQQYNLRTNVNASINKYLNLQVNLAGRRRVNEAPGYSAYDVFRELSRALPTNLAYYPDGTPARPSFSPNHILEGIKDFNAGYYRARNNSMDAKVSLEWDANQIGIQGLKLKSYASLVNNTSYSKTWGKSYELYSLNRLTGEYDEFIASPEGSFSETVLTQSMNYSNHYVLQESVNYKRQFNKHSISGLLLGELQNIQGENFYGRRQDFQSSLIDQLFAGSNENKDANGGEFRENRLGLVGRVSYDYLAKYFIG
jgi:TonB-linked SusC/RagA family outer membrane protein